MLVIKLKLVQTQAAQFLIFGFRIESRYFPRLAGHIAYDMFQLRLFVNKEGHPKVQGGTYNAMSFGPMILAGSSPLKLLFPRYLRKINRLHRLG